MLGSLLYCKLIHFLVLITCLVCGNSSLLHTRLPILAKPLPYCNVYPTVVAKFTTYVYIKIIKHV